MGLSRGHVELNLFAGSLGRALGTHYIFMLKWWVVIALTVLVRITRHQQRLNFILARTISILTMIVWLGVGWNLAMLYFFG